MLSEAEWQRLSSGPAFGLDRAVFERALGERPQAAELDDLFLATAALAGDPAAQREVLALLHAGRAAAARLASQDDALLDDVEQEVARTVLAGPIPKLADYTAQGPLAGWLRAALVRTTLNLLKARGREVVEEHVEDLFDRVGATAGLQPSDTEVVRGAIRQALARLEPRQRTLLRLHHLEAVSLERLATMFQVHRATAARWLADAREEVLVRTREQLSADLRLRPEEVESLLSTVRSRLDLSFKQLL
ncbi:MAG: sigma factor-like helix-turn-helix DNA-binding protein [Myxococcales bacterium]